MSANNKNFFKAIYMFVVLFLLDIALVYSLLQLGDGPYRKIDAIACFGAINAIFIYLNIGEIKVIHRYIKIKVIHRYIKEGRFVEGIKKAIRLLKYSKTSYFARISSIIIGICFIGWGIQVESGILIKLIAFTIGGINLWRSI
ncbi:MAG: hypothetical protein E6X90_10430 [Veillonella sp.]|nr:hypothetical protein [Veillonella sp.]